MNGARADGQCVEHGGFEHARRSLSADIPNRVGVPFQKTAEFGFKLLHFGGIAQQRQEGKLRAGGAAQSFQLNARKP